MSHSLIDFHFNPRKLGQILKQLCKERGISKAALASKIGLSYDTIDNIFGGKIQEASFEKLFKVCCVIGIPMEVLMVLMLKDEDIDFRDEVLLYDVEGDESMPVSDIDQSQTPGPVSDTVSAVAGAVAAAESQLQEVRVPGGSSGTEYSREDVSMFLDRIERQHVRHIGELQEQFAHERAITKEYYDRTYDLLSRTIGKE